LRQLQANRSALAIAATSWHEALFGVQRLPLSARRRRLEQYLETERHQLVILPYEETAAEWHADERARLTAIGLTPSFADGQIAAVAAVNGLILVTANVADFRHFQGLTVESWHV
jgi:tRNA(fMet)-specific endonuclease VapC